MNDLKAQSHSRSDQLFQINLKQSLVQEKEFIRVYDKIKVQEKIPSDFVSLNDIQKLEIVIKCFFTIKSEKENLLKNFFELENESRSQELDNKFLKTEVRIKEEDIQTLNQRIDELTSELSSTKRRIIMLEQEIKKIRYPTVVHTSDYSESKIKTSVEPDSDVNRLPKKEFFVNKFLNNNKILLMKEEKGIENHTNIEIDNAFSLPKNNLNSLIEQDGKCNNENALLDYMRSSHKSSDIEIPQTEESNQPTEGNEKLRASFTSQINQSVSIYESVYETYDMKYNIGEYDSSSYQSLNIQSKQNN